MIVFICGVSPRFLHPRTIEHAPLLSAYMHILPNKLCYFHIFLKTRVSFSQDETTKNQILDLLSLTNPPSQNPSLKPWETRTAIIGLRVVYVTGLDSDRTPRRMLYIFGLWEISFFLCPPFFVFPKLYCVFVVLSKCQLLWKFYAARA